MKSVCHHILLPRWLNVEEKLSFDSHRSYLLKVYSITINIIFTAILAKRYYGGSHKTFLKRKKWLYHIFLWGFQSDLYAAVSSKSCLTLWVLLSEPDGIKFSSRMGERFHRPKNRFRVFFWVYVWVSMMISNFPPLYFSTKVKWTLGLNNPKAFHWLHIL